MLLLMHIQEVVWLFCVDRIWDSTALCLECVDVTLGVYQKRSHIVLLRLVRLFPTSDIYGAVVSSAYLSRIEYTIQQCGQSYLMYLRRGHCGLKISGVLQCLTVSVSAALLEYDGKIVSTMLNCARRCSVDEMPAGWMSWWHCACSAGWATYSEWPQAIFLKNTFRGDPQIDWKHSQGDPAITWWRSMIALPTKRSQVGDCRLVC